MESSRIPSQDKRNGLYKLKLSFLTLITLSVIFLLAVCVSCASWRTNILVSGGIDAAVNNAIIDYIHTTTISSKRVFHVKVIESSDFYGVSVVSNQNKFYYLENEKVFSSDLPDSFIEINNRLFYWNGQQHNSTMSSANILYKYHVLDTVQNLGYTQNIIDENLKVTMYFICKDNLNHYRKKISKGTLSYTLENLTFDCKEN